MDPCGLATAIRVAMGFPSPNSAQLVGWATGVIDEIKTGIVSHAVVTGCGGGPLSCGAAAGGVIVCVIGTCLAIGIVASSDGQYGFVSGPLNLYACAVATHITCCGVVCFAPGTITGSAPSCSPLACGAGTCGMIVCLCGPALAAQIAAKVGYPTVSAPLCLKATAMVCYITNNAEVTYAAGTVTGCINSSCVLVGGVGAGGTIS